MARRRQEEVDPAMENANVEGTNPELENGTEVANEAGDVAGEMQGTDLNGEGAEQSGEQAGDAEAKDDRKWHNQAGEEVSKSAFIREQYEVLNKSRKDIAEEYKIPYRTVYGATMNMTNAAEPSTRGRGIVNPKIKVTADGKVLIEENDKLYLNGEEITAEDAAALEVTEVDRNDWIKEQVAAGVARGDVAKYLMLSYGVVYGMTKESENTRQKHMVEYDNKEITRAEYIRILVAQGKSKGDIAKQLGVEYSVVWQATKQAKTDKEKFADIISSVEKYTDKIVDTDENKVIFTQAVELLKKLEIKVEEVKEEETTEAEVAAEGTEAAAAEDTNVAE